ncbi:MAG: DUF2303 family protein [Propionivibrio sp.]|nr:DUF2303 family protein [Propionivibrio sp.]
MSIENVPDQMIASETGMALSMGAALSDPKSAESQIGEIPFVVVPDGFHVEDLEKHLPVPVRKRAAVVVSDSSSFIAYCTKHAVTDAATIYAAIDSELQTLSIVAVLDDHKAQQGSAMWRDHTCTFNPKRAVEWTRWQNNNKNPMNQADFAAWLEDNLSDIAAVPDMPTGAQMLQMALGFEANSDKRVKSRINLQNGSVRFEFVEDETKDTRTSMEVFQRFSLGLPVFDGSASAYQLDARLKYREKEGKVSFWYELIRPDRVFKTAVAEELAKIGDGTKFLIVYGKPW